MRFAESILRLLCTIFDTDTATCALLTGKAIYLTGACGVLSVCECPARWGFCGWSFLNANHDMLIVEDMDQDNRCGPSHDACANLSCIAWVLQ